MRGDFDTSGFWVIPKNVASRIRHEAEEDAFPRVGAKLGTSTTGGADPNTTTKGAEVRKIVNAVKGKLERGCSLVTRRERVVNA